MANTNGTTGTQAERVCFVISAFGKNPDEQRAHKQVLKHLVGKVLTPRSYEVIRADQIADEGLITNQIIEHLLDDDLVVADLTALNPNVFYEMAVRHAARRPIVHLITDGVQIPFDVANVRAVKYSLDDPDRLEEAQEELEQKVAAIESSGWTAAPNPITSVRDVSILQQSEEPATRQAGDVLAAVHELRDEVQTLNLRFRPLLVERRPDRSAETYLSIVRQALIDSAEPTSAVKLGSSLGLQPSQVRVCLKELQAKDEAHLQPGAGWIADIPF